MPAEMEMYKKIAMLFAVLVGGALAFIINQQNTARAENEKSKGEIGDPVIVEAGCYGSDERKCFTEDVNGRKRTYYGVWQERTVH